MADPVLPPRRRLARTPTPLLPLERLSRQLGGPRLWVKRDDLSGGISSGNKLRKLEFILEEALAEHCDTLITCGGVQSNHCRATAAVGARCGLAVQLVLRGEEPAGAPDGNLLLARLLGAEIHFLPGEEYQRRQPELMQELGRACQARGGRARLVPTGGSDATGVWGYIAAAQELRDDFKRAGIRPQHLVCATGSGGTQAGLSAGTALFSLDARVWGINVCDDAQWFLEKIRTDLRAWRQKYHQELDVDAIPLQVLDGYVGEGYGRADEAVFATMRSLAHLEGLVLDPVYTGKAFHGMLEEYKRGRFGRDGDVVFIHTGGVYGIFPQREAFFPGGQAP